MIDDEEPITIWLSSGHLEAFPVHLDGFPVWASSRRTLELEERGVGNERKLFLAVVVESGRARPYKMRGGSAVFQLEWRMRPALRLPLQ